MPEHNLSGLQLAIHLKSGLLRRLAATPPDEWRNDLAQFAIALERSHLEDATALVVLLVDLREQLRMLAAATVETTRSAPVDERALWTLSREEVMAWFQREWQALLASVPAGRGIRSLPLHDAVQFIDAHYAERITLQAIADAVGTSKRQLATLFRRQMGQSVHQYLTDVRLRHSIALIREGAKIEAVSLMVGYKSRKNFYRHFKSVVGMTPSAYKAVFRAR